MALEPIKRLIPSSLEKAGWKPQIEAMMVLEYANKVLRGLWGEEKARRVTFVSIKDGCLKASSPSGAAVQDLKVMEVRLLNEINRAIGSKKVTSLKAGRF